MNIRRVILIIGLSLLVAAPSPAVTELDFTLHKSSDNPAGKTLLVIGGIQGDEPGGFNAASLLVTRYRINRGNIWVVPNLNFPSIINSSRGVYGDLNRKFAQLSEDDPEFSAIQKIKAIITDPRVDAVLNLHDGSGFYRPRHIDDQRNPDRWGQSIVIDQETLENVPFGDLSAMARKAADRVNRTLFRPDDLYHVHNTRTGEGDLEMAKTLTYYAIGQGKPAFGLEASKNFNTPTRVYYHLQLIEAYMEMMGIDFDRGPSLTPDRIKAMIEEDAQLAFFDNRLFLDVAQARNNLRFVPFRKGSAVQYISSNPILAVVAAGDRYRIYHGNRRLTSIHPQFFDFDTSMKTIAMTIDGDEKNVAFGDRVSVDQWFCVNPNPDYRVNVIGFKRAGGGDEAGLRLIRNDFMRRFSVDRKGFKYRVEVYRKHKFAGMILVDFSRGASSRLLAAYPRSVPHPPVTPPLEASPPGTGR